MEKEREQILDEIIQLRVLISKIANHGIVLSLSGDEADMDTIKRHYEEFSVKISGKDVIDKFLENLAETVIICAENRLESLIHQLKS
jgi:hypothetical protein